jgi:hypothetical protein
MSNPVVTTTIGHVDSAAAPLNINELIDILNPRIHSEIIPPNSYVPYVISYAAPGPNDTDKIWFELDSQQRPIAVKRFWHGNWRRVYNGMLGEIRFFSGDPSEKPTTWDANGKGKPGGIYDGWQICNGENGSPDLTDKFIVGGKWGEESPVGWKSKVVDPDEDGVHEGGAAKTMILHKHLPPINPTGAQKDPPEATNELWIHGKGFKEDTDHTNALPIIDTNYGGGHDHAALLSTYGAGGGSPAQEQLEFPTVPPFIAFGYIIFIGYS